MASLSAPPVHTRERCLRILGTEISLIAPIKQEAEADLGIRLSFEVLDFQSCEHKAATCPGAFDVYDQCFHNLDIVWYWGALQPIDTNRIDDWDRISGLTREGGISRFASRGFGDAPVSRLYAQPGGFLGPEPTRHISMLPTVHNFDSFGYERDLFGDVGQDHTSWSWLIDSRAKGRIALVDEPAIGLFDAALACQAAGLLTFDDIGDMTVEEIDALMAVLEDRRRQGYFHTMWRCSTEAAELFRNRRVAVQSMWSPAYVELGERSAEIVEAVPIEGYRAWHGGLALSAGLTGAERDMAYDYLNWWLTGTPGAVMARRGYYMSIPERVRDALTPAEWAYWYEGAPAAADLPCSSGGRAVPAGTRRAGGSYWERAHRIALWNTTMNEHNYAARAWARFVRRVRGGCE